MLFVVLQSVSGELRRRVAARPGLTARSEGPEGNEPVVSAAPPSGAECSRPLLHGGGSEESDHSTSRTGAPAERPCFLQHISRACLALGGRSDRRLVLLVVQRAQAGRPKLLRRLGVDAFAQDSAHGV